MELHVLPTQIGICSGKYRTLQSQVVTLCTTRFDIQQFYTLPTNGINVSCVYQNKQKLLSYAA